MAVYRIARCSLGLLNLKTVHLVQSQRSVWRYSGAFGRLHGYRSIFDSILAKCIAPDGADVSEADGVAEPAAASEFLELGVEARLMVRAQCSRFRRCIEFSLGFLFFNLFLLVVRYLFVQDGLAMQGITNPSQVQKEAIPEILAGSNVAIQCYTGSGKTLSFMLPALTLAIKRSEEEWSKVTRKTAGQAGTVHAVIVVPSRELAMQIVRVAQATLPLKAKSSVQQCIGGANIHRQREALKMNKPIMVVGTPGRLAELSRDGSLQTHRCGILVLDEIDQLLAPQFREEMVRITEHTGKKCDTGRQTIVVSATMTARVISMCQPWCPKPTKIFIDSSGNRIEPPKEEGTYQSRLAQTANAQGEFPSRGWGDPDDVFPEGIPVTTSSAGGVGSTSTPSIAPGLTHLYVVSSPQHKVDALRRALHALDSNRALVFMNFQHRLKEAEAKLKAKKMAATSLHGELNKQERRKALDAFRNGKVQILLVSDVAARGLDVPECDTVVNLELPSDPAHYAHRAGRTGRAGREGNVVSLVSPKEEFVVSKFSQALGIDLQEVEPRFGKMQRKEES